MKTTEKTAAKAATPDAGSAALLKDLALTVFIQLMMLYASKFGAKDANNEGADDLIAAEIRRFAQRLMIYQATGKFPAEV